MVDRNYPEDEEKAPVTWGTPEMYQAPQVPQAPPDQGSATPAEMGRDPSTWEVASNLPTYPGVPNPSLTPGLPGLPVRENPFGAEPDAQATLPNGAPAPGPNPDFQQAIQKPTGPLSDNTFSNKQVDLLEQKKIITAEEAYNLRQHSLNESNIYGGYSREDREAAEQSRRDLLQAQRDAARRDEEVRAMIREQYDKPIKTWWEKKSTGEKILGGIGMILGGFGAGLTRGPNVAMQVMNNAINEDLQAQKMSIDKNYEAISKMHGLNEATFNRELHKQVWENNYRNAALERIKLDLAKNAANTQSETVKNNAKMGIIGITDEQNKIRNQQWKLAQAQMQAERARIRKLQDDYSKDVIEFAKKEGVDMDQAASAVGGFSKYDELSKMGQTGTAYTRRLEQMAQADLAKQLNVAKLIGAKPGDPKYNEIMDVVRNDPKYESVFKVKSTGAIVPEKKQGQETEEQLRNRTVNYTDPISGQTVQRLTINKDAAKAWQDFSEAEPDVKHAYSALMQAKEKGDRGAYNAARAQLIDSMPKFMLGSGASGPTKAQTEETYGQMIPTYYDIGGGGTESKLKHVGVLIHERRRTMESTTFGQNNTSSGESKGVGKTSTGKSFDFKPGTAPAPAPAPKGK